MKKALKNGSSLIKQSDANLELSDAMIIEWLDECATNVWFGSTLVPGERVAIEAWGIPTIYGESLRDAVKIASEKLPKINYENF